MKIVSATCTRNGARVEVGLLQYQMTLSSDGCHEVGKTLRLNPSVDDKVFVTISDVNGWYGSSNYMSGSYPKYLFHLEDFYHDDPSWDGVSDFDDVHVEVQVFPCDETKDPVLDDPAVRTQIKELMAKSNPDSSTHSMKRQERGGAVYRHVDSLGVVSHYISESMDAIMTPCSWKLGSAPPRHWSDSAVAYIHTHPNMPGDSLFGCPNPNVRTSPSDNNPYHVQAFAGDEKATGGGSDADWNIAYKSSERLAVYVVAKQGTVAKLPPGVKSAAARRANKNIWWWKNNPTGCRGF